MYYGLRCAGIAAETLIDALRQGDVSAKQLAVYERRWKQLLGREIRKATLFRRVIERLSDRELNQLLSLAGQEAFMRLLERRANFDWHGDLIVGMSRNPRFAAALLRGVVRLWLPA